MKFNRKTLIIVGTSLVILITVLLSLFKKPAPPLATTQLTTPVATTDQTSLSTTFSKPLSGNDQGRVRIESNPDFNPQLQWQSGQTVKITPKGQLEPDTDYQVKVLYNGQLVDDFSFTSSPYTAEQSLEYGRLQTEDDLLTGETFKELHTKYPWYSKIPIETEDYRIVYDFDLNAFRIRLLKTDTPTVRNQALETLKNIGVDLSTNQYYFLQPDSGFQTLLP